MRVLCSSQSIHIINFAEKGGVDLENEFRITCYEKRIRHCTDVLFLRTLIILTILDRPLVAEIAWQASKDSWEKLANPVLILFVLWIFTCSNKLSKPSRCLEEKEVAGRPDDGPVGVILRDRRGISVK